MVRSTGFGVSHGPGILECRVICHRGCNRPRNRVQEGKGGGGARGRVVGKCKAVSIKTTLSMCLESLISSSGSSR